MKISQFLKNIRKDQHGVAIVFTLGILGLLTVIALGFASTALLNGKLAKNVSNDAYAKSMAKNLALSQAMATLNYVNANPWEQDFGKIYSYDDTTETSINGTSIPDRTRDFLWKLNTCFNTAQPVQIFSYDPSRTDSTRSTFNPLQNVRWRYVRESSNDNARIIGRYAYVMVPDKGRLNPNIHVGNSSSTSSYPSQVLSFRTNRNSDTNNSTAWRNLINIGRNNTFRITQFYDLYRRTSVANSFYWFEDIGMNIIPAPRTREAYYAPRYYEGEGNDNGTPYRDYDPVLIDDQRIPGTDYRRIAYDWYKRYDMNSPSRYVRRNQNNEPVAVTSGSDDVVIESDRWSSEATSWDEVNPALAITVADLMGLNRYENALRTIRETPSATARILHEVLYDNPDGRLTFIPILRDLWHSTTDPNRRNQYKQIAANIIQYNRPYHVYRATTFFPDGRTRDRVQEVNETVAMLKEISSGGDVSETNVDPDRPLTLEEIGNTNTNDVPVYMGIGRHPMLNEIGMCIRVAGGVSVVREGEQWRCTPFFNITMNIGAELVRLFSQIEEGPYQLFFYGTMSATVEFPTSPNSKGTATVTLDLSHLNDIQNNVHRFIQTCSSSYTSRENFFYSPAGNDAYSLGHQINLKAGETRAEITLLGVDSPNLSDLTVENGDSLKQFTDPSDAEPDYSSSLRIINVSFNLSKVILRCNDRIRDISVFTEQTNSNENSIPRCYYASFQARNPLMNLNRDFNEWRTYTANNTTTDEAISVETYNNVNGTAGRVNSEIAAGCPGGNPTQLPFAFMRQGPMQSFAELACIHSGYGWNTIDLTRKRLANNPLVRITPDGNFSTPGRYPAFVTQNLPEFDQNVPALGALFDQLKFSNQTETYGQINLNTDSHAALYSLLNYTNTMQLTTSSSATTISDAINHSSGNLGIPLRFCLPPQRESESYARHDHCAVCAIRDCTVHSYTDSETQRRLRPPYLFRNRGDLLAVLPDNPNANNLNENNYPGYRYDPATRNPIFENLRGNLNDVQSNIFDRISDQTRKNLAAVSLMENARTAPIDSAYIIIVTQTIQDQGGVPLFVDLDGNGEFSPTALTMSGNTESERRLRRKLGYRSDTGIDLPGAPSTIRETYAATDTQIGRYDLGADKITGEAKLIAKVVRDGITGRWKIVEIRYVE